MVWRLHIGSLKGANTLQVSNQIDKLIQSLNELKPLLSNDKKDNAEKFADVLKDSLETSSNGTEISTVMAASDQKKVSEDFDWVDPSYRFDPNNPRKPNIRELMEVISGKSINELNMGSEKYRHDIYHDASEILYGVIGANKDTRNWFKIMSDSDVLSAAKAETGKMYEPNVELQSNGDGRTTATGQIAVLKDKNGTILRSIPNETSLAENMLRNFGATNASIPANLKDQVISDQFDDKLLSFLENYDSKSENLEQIVLQAATDSIVEKLQDDISFKELNKL
mgnify:CR=1 FL=1